VVHVGQSVGRSCACPDEAFEPNDPQDLELSLSQLLECVPVTEADLGMFSMFGRTGAPTKKGPHKWTGKFFQHSNIAMSDN